MLSLIDTVLRGHRSPSRREWLRIGGLSAMGLSLPQLLHAQGAARAPGAVNTLSSDLGATFGKAKNVIFLWLQGGPPQHETFDPKPDAPVEIRGPFKPIATNIPGIHFSELLPRTACHADKLAVVRSLATRDDNHDVSGYWLLTGYPYGPGSARQIKPGDWPYFGSIVKMLKPSERLPALSTVWIPDVMRLNDNVTPAGQTAGFLGKMWEPERFVGDPASATYAIQGLDVPEGMTTVRVDRRRDLLAQLNQALDPAQTSDEVAAWDRLSQHALDLVTSGQARAAFDLTQESDKLRDRYGRYTWGQSCLLARRLIEAGVRLVHVNWARDPGDSAVDNPMWDTHAQNADRLHDSLCPMFDVTFDALMADLADRGLLEETLVVVVGEFGRTPRINHQGGRDHWGHVFSMALAGAGIRGGQVIGASDKNGAYPTTDPIRGGDLTATIFHLLGIDPGGMFYDKTHRPHPLTRGEPIRAALGLTPATEERQPSTGNRAFVPAYDPSWLLDANFDTSLSLVPAAPLTRDKGWRADPIADRESPQAMTVEKRDGNIRMGYGLLPRGEDASIPSGSQCILAQEIRNARGGQYTFAVHLRGVASSPEEYEQTFLREMTCQLLLFRFADAKKDPRQATVLASKTIAPRLGQDEVATIDQFLGSRSPGANFPIGNGLGVAVVIRKQTAGDLVLPASGKRYAGIELRRVVLEFQAAPRDENNNV